MREIISFSLKNGLEIENNGKTQILHFGDDEGKMFRFKTLSAMQHEKFSTKAARAVKLSSEQKKTIRDNSHFVAMLSSSDDLVDMEIFLEATNSLLYYIEYFDSVSGQYVFLSPSNIDDVIESTSTLEYLRYMILDKSNSFLGNGSQSNSQDKKAE